MNEKLIIINHELTNIARDYRKKSLRKMRVSSKILSLSQLKCINPLPNAIALGIKSHSREMPVDLFFSHLHFLLECEILRSFFFLLNGKIKVLFKIHTLKCFFETICAHTFQTNALFFFTGKSLRALRFLCFSHQRSRED
jgi:hypothetical protein